MSSSRIDHKQLIGITGGIGSGKSVVSRILSVMGYPVYDCDSFAKRLMNDSPVIREALVDRFGSRAYVDGALNRRYLADMMFSDSDCLDYVNSVVHPVVCRHFLDWSASFHSDKVFVESAILFSSGLDRVVDYAVYVDAPYDVRLRRAVVRDSASCDAVEARMRSQMADEEFARLHSRFCIVNDGRSLVIPQLLDFLARS